jgi:hypothetical protein
MLILEPKINVEGGGDALYGDGMRSRKTVKNEKMKTDHAIAVHWEPPCFSCPFPLVKCMHISLILFNFFFTMFYLAVYVQQQGFRIAEQQNLADDQAIISLLISLDLVSSFLICPLLSWTSYNGETSLL